MINFILWYLLIGTIAWCIAVLLDMIVTALLMVHFESKGKHIVCKIGFAIGCIDRIISKLADEISKMGLLKAIFNLVVNIVLWPIAIILLIILYIMKVIPMCSNYYK